ncbi:YIP1 family protein [Qingshengfaniella alkalisoli]|uniref:YIP1 family protein n=1 Tax=Qingshengfaniella alkalisoli TaxID=2599296 RepID=A0A5B8IWK6_9RHOB|nr:YIP1 family protein [Qingshengfaniella alkalisoli]QDY69221.1 YIP1 family protein [Qingshengfaniella alkalisoli]
MSVTRDIVASYRAPRRVMRRLLAAGQREDRALVTLLLACGLIFVAQLPRLSREATLNPDVPFDARVGAALLAWGVFMPLICYGIAAISHLVARALGGKGSWFTARIALFWSMLVATPVWLLHGLTAGFIGPGPELTFVGLVLAAVFCIVWLASLIEGEWPKGDNTVAQE